MATIADVARDANVSVATVSRIINGKTNVRNETKKRVLDAIERLHYTPNVLGKCLRESRTGIILVSIPTISNPFYAEIVRGISDCAVGLGYNIMLCSNEGDVERERSYCEVAKTKLVDGMIFLASSITTEEMQELVTLIPVVQCCEYNENVKTPIITTDNVQSAIDAVQYLIDIGSKKIGMLSSCLENSSAADREIGYRTALLNAGLPYDPTLIGHCRYDNDSSKGETRKLLEQHPEIDALFCISDIMAFNAIKVGGEMGRRIPDDLSVIGFDNIPIAMMSTPSITTVNQQGYKLGYYSMKILHEQSQADTSLRSCIKTYVDYEIIERESTRKRK